jgi:hypothetical protein
MCPKCHDPESDADCQCGDVLPCPPGFAETEDGVACEPIFDECGDNEIPLLGGGCTIVGPRMCPKCYDPDSQEDCECGDILPCPDGLSETEDGTACEPIFDECGDSEVPILGGGCKPVGAALPCPEDPWPEPPEGATALLYVDDDSTCQSACGSKDKPHKSVYTAVADAPEGAAVLLAEG